MRLASDFWRSKTTWLGVAAIVQAVIGHYTGSLSGAETVMAIYAALTAIFVRDAVTKAGEIHNGTR